MGDSFLVQSKFPRRFFLAQGTRLFALGSLGALVAVLARPGTSFGQDWRNLFDSKPQGGHGTVKELRGRASANGRPLRFGERVNSGEKVEVSADSRLILSLSDNTIMRINANTLVTLEMSTRRTGFFKLVWGSLLTVMPIGNRYLVHLPSAVVGIKGTVFFHQIYRPGEKFAFDQNFIRVEIPEGINEYFCLCNGLADFMGGQAGSPFFSDKSEYHNSYYIDPRLPDPMVEAPQLNHTDQHIIDLVALQDGAKHTTQFLDKYR